MLIRIKNWGTYLSWNGYRETGRLVINEKTDLGLKGDLITGYNVIDEKKFMLAVIKYSLEYEVYDDYFLKLLKEK